ncbi:MAG TPA: DUF4334 domain-containing protein [Fluviicoccus sp.]|nr:DUF4334 domain-containing protein [Fluviicoccus sp.]
MSVANNRTVLYFPSVAYDLIQLAMFPLNYAIGGLCYLQPGQSEWNGDDFAAQDVRGSGKSVETLKQELLGGADIAFNEQDLVRLYDALPAVSARDDLIGRTWKGRIVRTGGSVLDLAEWAIVRPLSKLGLAWGKRYRSADQGDPLLFNWKGRVFTPVPLWGNVGMTDIRWRGETTATMNYDHQPWKDYFKLLGDDNGKVVLLGVWTHKHIAGGWFTLTLDAETPTKP